MKRAEDNREQVLQRVYGARFGSRTDYRTKVWRVLAPHFGQWFSSTGAVLDLGAGFCEFINNAHAGKKYAMDLNPEIYRRAGEGVVALQQDCTEPWPLPDGELDAVFTSNFLEHLPDRESIVRVLSSAYRCLKPGGRLIAMGPNIKHVAGAYWDFFDHYVELTELSLAEALTICGFEVETVVGRFLPYTMSVGRQYPIWMLRCYLAFPAAWSLFGKQFLVVGRKQLLNEEDTTG